MDLLGPLLSRLKLSLFKKIAQFIARIAEKDKEIKDFRLIEAEIKPSL